MNNEFKDRIFKRMAIGGSLQIPDIILILKDLVDRVGELENQHGHGETSVSRSTDSKVSKRKAASAGVPAESDDKG